MNRPVRLEAKNIRVDFPGKTAVDNVDLKLEEGRIGCLLGPSGCGKSTLLRVIAGFQQPAEGEVLLHGKRVSSPTRMLAPEKRNVGMVFQDFALFPHLTVEGNVAFGLDKMNRFERKQRVTKMLELIGLEELVQRYPHQLSGGQQQRIALARALAPRPEILLLDEPFSSLDVELREQLAREVRSILKQLGTTAILVTHDQMEAFALADEIGVMHEGRLHQWDTPHNIYHNPADRTVASFIGQGVMLQGTVLEEGRINTAIGVVKCWNGNYAVSGKSVEVLIRPDDITHDDDSPLRAKVVGKVFRGAEFLYTLEVPSGDHLLCLAPSHHDHKLGESIGFKLDDARVPTFTI